MSRRVGERGRDRQRQKERETYTHTQSEREGGLRVKATKSSGRERGRGVYLLHKLNILIIDCKLRTDLKTISCNASLILALTFIF